MTDQAISRPRTGRRHRKADRVAEAILKRVVSGNLPVGGLLPKEDLLAAEFSVNRGVVREAIKLLEVHELVRPVRRLGTLVLDPHLSASPAVLSAMLEPEPGTIDERLFSDLLELRETLDVKMTTLAAERRTDDDLAAMDRCLDRLASLLGDPEGYARAVAEMAGILALASKNRLFRILTAWHERITERLGPVFAVVLVPSQPHLQGMRLLVDLVRRKNAEGVADLVRRFHAFSIPRLLAAASLGGTESYEELIKEVSR